MKRLLLVALLGLCLVSESAHAQRGRRSAPLKLGMTFGVKAGGAYVNIKGYDAGSLPPNQIDLYEGRFELVAGALANYRFTAQLSAQVEALYAPRGSNRFAALRNGREEQFELTYVDIPILAKYNHKIIYVEAGGVASLLLDAKVNAPAIKRVDPVTDLNSLDLGFALGAGVELPNGAIFGARFVRSTASIGKGGFLVGGQSLENSAIQVTGGYIFNHTTRRGRKH